MAEKKSSVGTFVNEKILPSVMKFVNTKAVVALKDGMVYALPFIIEAKASASEIFCFL